MAIRPNNHISRLTQLRHRSAATIQRHRLLGEHLVEGPGQFFGLGGLEWENSDDPTFTIGSTEGIQFIDQPLDLGLTFVRGCDDEDICAFSDTNFNRIRTPLAGAPRVEAPPKQIGHRRCVGVPHPEQTQWWQRTIAQTIHFREQADAGFHPPLWTDQHQLIGDRQHRNIHGADRLPGIFGVFVKRHAQPFGHLFGVATLDRDHPSHIRSGKGRTGLIHGLFHALHRR